MNHERSTEFKLERDEEQIKKEINALEVEKARIKEEVKKVPSRALPPKAKSSRIRGERN